MAWKGLKDYAERNGLFDKRSWYNSLCFLGVSAFMALCFNVGNKNTATNYGKVINERRTQVEYEFTLQSCSERKDISYIVRGKPEELETLDRKVNNGDYVSLTIDTHLSDKGAHIKQTDTKGRIVLKPNGVKVGLEYNTGFIIPR